MVAEAATTTVASTTTVAAGIKAAQANSATRVNATTRGRTAAVAETEAAEVEIEADVVETTNVLTNYRRRMLLMNSRRTFIAQETLNPFLPRFNPLI